MTLTYGSVCSGIEAASVAWKPLGWATSFVSEIEAAPRAVLQHRFPEVPLHGDFTTIREGEYGAIDLLVGGTPCQSFSVAGLRGGLADDRGNLALQYLRLAQRLRPRWLVWENVPGVLSSSGGRDFGAILGGMVELGYGFAYRVLDAQYVRVDGFGRAVPQRRRRVFVVGHLGDWRRPAAVLLERACLRGDPAPRREAGAGIADSLEASLGRRCGTPNCGSRDGQLITAHAIAEIEAGWNGHGTGIGDDGDPCPTLMAGKRHGIAFGGNDTRGPIQVATSVNAHGGPCGRMDFESETFIAQATAPTLDANFGRLQGASGQDLNHGHGHLVAFDTTQITSAQNRNNPQPGDPCHPLAAGAHPPAVAFNWQGGGTQTTLGYDPEAGTVGTLAADQTPAIAYGIRSDASRDGAAKTPSADAEGRVRLRDPGLGIYDGLAPTLDAGQPHTVAAGWSVRRLTPTECERLQGFPDSWTAVPWRGGIMPDGPRYKMLGNSMAVNVMRWIGRRIEAVDALGLQIGRAA
jgi:DNA (cytosine-5)-methyltransferase 1